nr:phosphatidylinositide phosphatase SAC2 isoform X3 [Halyomorpha halys]
MTDPKTNIPEMEAFRTEDFYVLMNSESSLWCNRKTGDISVRPGWELANSGDVECLGVFYGLVGKISFQTESETRLLLIKETEVVGDLPDGRTVIKIRSIAFLYPCGPDVSAAEIGLKSCKKHRAGGCNLFEVSQKAPFAKTWGTMKSAASSLKSTTQQAAALASYQVKGSSKKEGKDREKFEKRIIEELSRLFTETDSFYFCLGAPGSRTCDLTNSLQTFHKPGSSTDDRFFWNKHMLKDIYEMNNELAKAWILPIIQGYVQIEHCAIHRDMTTFGASHCENLTLAIVSRRSRHRAGTRYKRRGLDEHGNCANYVETEQILSNSSHTVSFVQVRGSVPLFWSQPGFKYRPPPRIDKGEGETKLAFEKHMKSEIAHYGPVCIINLAEQVGKERVIWEGFTQHVLQFNSDQVIYAVFDFHEHCRGMKFENVSLLLSKLQDVIQEMGFCWKDKDGIICHQNGVFRVNCIDCLDRTNVVQTAIGRTVLEIQLTKLGLLPPEGQLPTSLKSKFQLLWANNGDIISKQYAGTNALKGDFTRTGERKFTGLMKDGMNSANRYYLSRFKDVYRQATIDIMQGEAVTEEALEVESDVTAANAEHVKLLIEDCKKLLVSDSSLILGAWGLINADLMTGDPTETDMDTILILTKDSYYVADYDDEVDKVVKCQKVNLRDITCFELGQIEVNPGQSGLQIFNKTKGKATLQCCLRIHYSHDSKVFAHVFRSSHLRFFNNVAILIKGEDEMIESLRAICDAFKIAIEMEQTKDTNEVLNIDWKIDPDSLLEGGALQPPPAVRNMTDLQLDSIKSVGSKALSNVTSKFSKLGNTFNPNRVKSSKSVKVCSPSTVPPEFSVCSEENTADDRGELSNSLSQSESFLPAVGIVMSNVQIDSVDPSDVVITEDKDSISNPPTQLRLRTFSHSSSEVDEKDRLEVSNNDRTERGSLELAISGLSTSQSENALRSLKTGFSQAAGTVLTSPSAVLSPLTRLAKGVLSSNSQENRKQSNLADLKETWAAAGCKTRLIAV